MDSFSKRTGKFLLAAGLAGLLAGCVTSGAQTQNTSTASKIDAALGRAINEAEASGNTQELLTVLEQAHKRNPEDAAVAVRFARVLREDEQLNRARLVLAPFVKGKDAHVEAMTELAMTQLGLGEYEEAEATAREAVDKDKENGRAFLALGTALDAQKKYDEAEEAFRKGIKFWRGDPAPILNNLALNLASQGYLDEAISILQKAKQTSPGRMEIERNLRIVSALRETMPGSPQAKTPPTPLKKPGQVTPAAGDNQDQETLEKKESRTH